MAVTVAGVKVLGAAKSIVPHCVDCAALTGVAGKGISFGLGIGLGGIMPFILVAGGMYALSVLMRKHMAEDIIMNPDQGHDNGDVKSDKFTSFFGRQTVL